MMLIWRNYSLITSLSKTNRWYRFCLSKLGLFFSISLMRSMFNIHYSTFSSFWSNIYRSYSPFWWIYLKVILRIKETFCFIDQRNIMEAAIDCCSAKYLFFFFWLKSLRDIPGWFVWGVCFIEPSGCRK